VVEACQRVVEKAKPFAAHLLECDVADLEFTGGRFQVRGHPEGGKTLADCALAVFAAHDLPAGVEPNLDGEAVYDPANFSFPHGTHLCAAEVDTETGRVTLRTYVAVDDAGRVVNPLIVEGQIHGGVAQGIAQALYEEAVYDEDGNLLTGTFVDYTPPSAADLPDIVVDRTETPARDHPLGVKGVGETGTIAATPAVVNAIVDALRPYGVHDVPMPCTPERVWRAIREGGERS
jgi:carbon-monoxide dehydrogenase large subunit